MSTIRYHFDVTDEKDEGLLVFYRSGYDDDEAFQGDPWVSISFAAPNACGIYLNIEQFKKLRDQANAVKLPEDAK